MARRTETNVWRSAHCVECQITWSNFEEDVVAKAEQHADQRRHRVHLREQFAYDLWPDKPSTPPRRDARPKI